MHEPIFTYLIIAGTVWVSLSAFRNSSIEENLIFCPRYILAEKQYHRLLTSAFLHANWRHLFSNMFTMYAFGQYIELFYGAPLFLAIYFAAIIGGSLLALWLHRNHEYRAYGASGGVSGILLASIFLLPNGSISLLFFPVPIPAWLYAIMFLLYEFYGVTKGKDNIGHDAHLGGAIIGLFTATAFQSEIIKWSPKLYATVTLLSLGMLAYLIKNPLLLPMHAFVSFKSRAIPKRAKPALSPEQEEEQVNKILDKISKKGMQGLKKEEHELLLKASRKNK
jgi:membrane associated rhomboid family serine protease